jgi:HlyD family type I secretion membrane fusion protein
MNATDKQKTATQIVSTDEAKTAEIAARQTTSPVKQDVTSLATRKVQSMSNDALIRSRTMSALPATLIGFGILALFGGGLALWIIFIPLTAIVSATAEVVFKGKRQTVQHLEGGIVEKILVKDGDLVQAGQALIVLVDKQVKPIARMIEAQNAAEKAQMLRLEAESRGQESFGSATRETGNKYLQTERRLFKARQEAHQNQIELMQIQISQINESLQGAEERFKLKSQEIESIRTQLQSNQTLLQKGYVSKSIVLDLQRVLAANSGELESIRTAIESDKKRITEIEQRIITLKSDRVHGVVNELKQSSLRRIDQEERIRPLQDTLERQVIRAPVTGRVVGLKVSTVGGTILPRETLMEIAPIGETLVLEAKIDLKDINEIRVGQEALVTISSFDNRKMLPLKAKVTYVSDDRISSTPGAPGPQQQPIVKYGAYLEFEPDSLKELGDNNKLLPGMSAGVSIAIAPRTALDYMINPMRESARKALRVR